MSKGYLGLEITSSRLRYTYIAKENGYSIQKAGNLNYKLDATALGSLTKTIQSLLKTESIAPQEIFVTVSQRETLIRQLLLPGMSSKELDEAIPAEIEKIPNFVNKKFGYIFHKDDLNNGKIRITFAAVHEQIVDYVISEIAQLKIDFRHLEISPLNFISLLPKETNRDQAVMIVNDRVSFFAVYRGLECRLFYQMTVGLDNFYPSDGGSIDERVLSNLGSELQRVLKSYAAENKGTSLDRIFLIWDKEIAPSFDQYVYNQLGIKIEIPRIGHLTVNAADKKLSNPIYLLAATPIVHKLFKISPQFPFDRFFKAQHLKRYMLKAGFLVVLFFSTVALVFAFININLYQQKEQLQQKEKNTIEEIARLRVESLDLYKRRDEYLTLRQGLLNQALYVQYLNRISWSQVLSVVANELPINVSLSSFKFAESGSVTFRGDAMQVETIAEVIRRVDDSSILQSAQFDYLRERKVEDQKVFQFGIGAHLKRQEKETK